MMKIHCAFLLITQLSYAEQLCAVIFIGDPHDSLLAAFSLLFGYLMTTISVFFIAYLMIAFSFPKNP